MACDEQYRAWAMGQPPEEAGPPGPGLRRAVLTMAGACAARAGFRELRFDVGGAAWSWCFPEAPGSAGRDRIDARMLILRPGPHSLVAEVFRRGEGGRWHMATTSLATAAELAVSGVPVFVHPTLTQGVKPTPTQPRS